MCEKALQACKNDTQPSQPCSICVTILTLIILSALLTSTGQFPNNHRQNKPSQESILSRIVLQRWPSFLVRDCVAEKAFNSLSLQSAGLLIQRQTGRTRLIWILVLEEKVSRKHDERNSSSSRKSTTYKQMTSSGQRLSSAPHTSPCHDGTERARAIAAGLGF